MDFPTRIRHFLGKTPNVHPSAYVAPGATVIGDVTLGEQSSVWFSAVVRADINRIVIGPRSNIQDGAVVHLADEFGTCIGELVTVGHKAIVHACTVGDEVLIGMGAIVLDGAEIGARSIIGAGALVTGGRKIPSRSLVRRARESPPHTLAQRESRHQSLGREIRRPLPRVPRARRSLTARRKLPHPSP